MAIANPAKLLHKHRRTLNVSTLALYRLHENGRYFLRRQNRLEQFVFDESCTGQCVLLAFAINIRICNVRHSRHQRRKTALLLRLRCRE